MSQVDDAELQDEPLQIRLMDYDTYSANDAIGKVYLDLNPLLVTPGLSGRGLVRSEACSVSPSSSVFKNSRYCLIMLKSFLCSCLSRW